MSDSDSSFFRTLIIVISSLAAFMIISIMIARTVTAKSPELMASDPMYQAAVLKRIKPVSRVHTTMSSGSAQVATAMSGESVYKTACLACHASGAAGAPKIGSKKEWQARIAQGMSTLLSHAIDGFKGMPAKGGRADLSDDAVKSAVKHMVASSQ